MIYYARMASDFYDNSVFWIEVERIHPNPFQPRKEFDQMALESLADSIKQYGVLQPLVVTRKERERSDGGISVEYELVAGERRLRASKLASLRQVPVLIRSAEDTDKMKLEIAIIENLQREDLNPIDRALAFKQLADNFNLKHIEIAKKVGKSREYVSNSLRLLSLPEEVKESVIAGKITEGHTRPLLMLVDRPEEQQKLHNEIIERHVTVREAERIARGIATERARKKDLPLELEKLEKELSEKLGTRVQIEQREKGGKLHIDFYSPDDIQTLLNKVLNASMQQAQPAPMENIQEDASTTDEIVVDIVETDKVNKDESIASEDNMVKSPLMAFVEDNGVCEENITNTQQSSPIEEGQLSESVDMFNENTESEMDSDEDDIYSLKNFVV